MSTKQEKENQASFRLLVDHPTMNKKHGLVGGFCLKNSHEGLRTRLHMIEFRTIKLFAYPCLRKEHHCQRVPI